MDKLIHFAPPDLPPLYRLNSFPLGR